MSGWVERTPEFIGRRYDRLAPIYGVFEWACLLPVFGVRRRVVEALALEAGDVVLEIGCGSGRNFARIERAIGPDGAILGVDVSAGMLRRAESLCTRRGFANVGLTHGDAATFAPARAPNALLFSFSYSVLPARREVLARAWDSLAPGGRVAILDLTIAASFARHFLLSYGRWQSGVTLLGKPDTEPWKDLAEHAKEVRTWRRSFAGTGHFVICAARKAGAQGR